MRRNRLITLILSLILAAATASSAAFAATTPRADRARPAARLAAPHAAGIALDAFTYWQAKRAAAAAAATAAALPPRWVTIAPGDTLSRIAGELYGHAGWWPALYDRNKAVIGPNPNFVVAGQRLHVTWHRPWAYTWSPPPPAPVQQAASAVTVVSAPAVTHATGVLTAAQVGSYWLQAGGPAWAESAAEAVAYCESGYNTAAYNPSGATGLWQILGAVVPGNLYDPLVNAENAVAKFRASGDTWSQWVCRP